ncbi:TPA: pirin family protein [Pseudomonas aeruginosa]|nr:pirin family protein [Pseudomonas aeruginosa]HBO5539695.1 pirin family protein [Pseudomonas aeruginosa]
MVAPIALSVRRIEHGDGFHAYMLRSSQGLLDPFLGVDHAWMSAPTFAPHTHAGFSAVSYLFLDSETGVHNRDSIGTDNIIRPGGVHWTTAGKGIVHEEIPSESNKTVHSLQIFVDLDARQKDVEPYPLTLEPEKVPVIRLPGSEVRIPIGGFHGVKSPLDPPTDVTLLDITLGENSYLSIPVEAGKIAFVIPVFGEVEIGGELYGGCDVKVAFLSRSMESYTVELKSNNGRAGVVVFVGEPIHAK